MMGGVTSVPEGRYRMTTGVTGGCGRTGSVVGVIVVVMIVVTEGVVVGG